MIIKENEIKYTYVDLFGKTHYITDDGDFEESEVACVELSLF
jgi:hypothetical protein